jgi:hypothetical protein
MPFDVVNIGSVANDGTGDSLRAGGTKINNNFAKAVEGPSSAVAGQVVAFNGTTGKLVQGGLGDGTAAAPSVSFASDTDTGLFRPAADTLAFSTEGVERWRFTSGGIFEAPGAQTIRTATGALTLATNGGNGNIILSPNGSGNVGIGTTSPGAKLDIGTATSTNQTMAIFGRQAAPADVNFQLLAKTGTGTITDTEFFKFGLQYDNLGNAFVNFLRGTTSTGGYITFSTNNDTERMRIDSAGNVGIGTTSPTTALTFPNGSTGITLSGANQPAILRNDNNGFVVTQSTIDRFRVRVVGGGFPFFSSQVQVGDYNAAGQPQYSFINDPNTGVANPAADALSVSTNSAERLRITSAGNVGIGTTSPTHLLDVNGRADINGILRVGTSRRGIVSADGTFPDIPDDEYLQFTITFNNLSNGVMLHLMVIGRASSNGAILKNISYSHGIIIAPTAVSIGVTNVLNSNSEVAVLTQVSGSQCRITIQNTAGATVNASKAWFLTGSSTTGISDIAVAVVP